MSIPLRFNQPVWLKVFSLLLVSSLNLMHSSGQNSLVGDGFGGRKWYKPYNYNVGSYSGYTICGDSSQLYAWGANLYGQLGNGTLTGSNVPIKVNNMKNLRYYSTGYCMGAIKKDNSAWVWGQNFTLPTRVLENVMFLDAGSYVCSFVKFDGTVWSVGRNDFGTFGNNTTDLVAANSAVQMQGVNNAVRVANGGYNNYILLRDGTVLTVGYNTYAGLGDGSAKNAKKLLPVPIPGLSSIVDIKASAYNGIALDSAGDIYTWGDGRYGCIGDGQFKDAISPKKVTSIKNIVAISACNDGGFFLALDINHNCYAWGRNFAGALGDGTMTDNPTPTLVSTNVDDIMAGETLSYIVKRDSTLWFAGTSSAYPDSKVSMDLNVDSVLTFTKVNPTTPPMNLCAPVKIYQGLESVLHISMCKGDSFKVKSKYYRNAGTYKDTLKSYYHFDSLITLNLSLKPISHFTQTIPICNGSSYRIGKNIYTKQGLYIDTLRSYIACDSIVSTSIIVKPIPIISQNIQICYGQKYKTGRREYSNAGIYNDTFVSHTGCDSIVITNLTIHPKPKADFILKDYTANTDDTLNLKNLSIGANLFKWHFGNSKPDTSTSIDPTIIFITPGISYIKLIAINNITGCSDTLLKSVEIIDNSDIFLPLSFTPNADELNDYFFPVSQKYDRVSMKIFNRWGELLYESINSSGWDGKYKNEYCQQGVYLYIIDLSNSSNHKTKTISGTISLLR